MYTAKEEKEQLNLLSSAVIASRMPGASWKLGCLGCHPLEMRMSGDGVRGLVTSHHEIRSLHLLLGLLCSQGGTRAGWRSIVSSAAPVLLCARCALGLGLPSGRRGRRALPCCVVSGWTPLKGALENGRHASSRASCGVLRAPQRLNNLGYFRPAL